MNTKKSLKNIMSGLFGQIITIIFGIYIPHLVIISLGSESNGLLSSVNTVIGYLNLLEAGVGTASLQALYGPVAESCETEINGILSATKQFYRKTGFYYGIGILGIALIYPAVVNSQLSVITISVVILLSGMPNVINFYFQGKYKILLQADGRNYILTNLQTCTSIITSLGKVILLNKGFGLCALQTMYCLVCLGQMIFIEIYVHKTYKWLNLQVAPNISALNQSQSVLVHQISGLVFSTTDTVILTLFCGLSTVSIYSVYTLLFGMISTLIQNVNSGVVFIMGQTFNTDREKYLKMHNAYEVYNMALTFSLYAIANIFILPFIKLYTSGAEISYIDKLLPYLFIATYLLENGRTAAIKVIQYAGHFKQTRWHAVVEMGLNLSVSIIGAYYLGIYGVLLGTIAALLFRSNIMIIYVAKNILNKSAKSTYWHWLSNLIVFIIAIVFSRIIFNSIVLDSYLKIAQWTVICCFVWIPVFFIVASLLNQDSYQYVKALVVKMFSLN